jgi:hypothetical protein
MTVSGSRLGWRVPFTFACVIIHSKSSSLLGAAVALISFAHSRCANRVNG